MQVCLQVETSLASIPSDVDEIRPPPLMFSAMEALRVGIEIASLMAASPFLARSPRGDGHGVLVLPGFATDDHATALLRAFLRIIGYDVHPWRLGWNLDHRTVGANGEHVARQIDRIVMATGRKVSLVGWSLGGIIAREAARRDPDAVRQVVTMGSPFRGNPHANRVGQLYEHLTGNKVESPASKRRFEAGPQPLPVPSTSIYSRSDGVAAWENCVAIEDHQSENVEIHASHMGMVVNPVVFHILADRLSQAEGTWAPYSPKGPMVSMLPKPREED